MNKNYFKLALRNIGNNKLFSAINILGLATGLTCCLLMILFIMNEIRYDKFHVRSGQIFRVTSIPEDAAEKSLAVTPAPWAPLMKNDYPEIKNYVRLLKDEKCLVGQPGEQHYYEKDLLFCDNSFFDIFSFSLVQGDPKHALEQPNSIILTKKAAIKYFGSIDPIGKSIEVATSFGRSFNLQVTGVANDAPPYSHIKFNGLISMSTMGDISGFWSFHMFHTYVLLANGASAKSLEIKFKNFTEKYLSQNANADGKHDISLQPLTDIHLYSKMVGEIGTNGDIIYVFIFSGVALLVLLIACFNFINLSTVRSLKRAKEVGLRKVIGAGRHQLIQQFLGESLLIAVFSMGLAFVITILVLPYFNQLAERNLSISISGNYFLILGFIGLAIVIGILAGLYPASVLSSFRPVEVLKGSFQKGVKGGSLRKALVTFQFLISITLISSTILVYIQLQYIKNKKLGFEKDEVIVISLPREDNMQKLETFKASLLNKQGIISVAAASSVPGTNIPVNQIHEEGAALNNNRSMQMLFVDHEFIKTMQMKVVAGRDFSKLFSTDENEGFIINQEAIKQLGWRSAEQAIGKTFQWVIPGNVLKTGKVIGVVENFNVTPLKSPVEPLVMHINPQRLQYLYIRFNNLTAGKAIDIVARQYKNFYAAQPIDYNFLNDTITAMYASENKLGKIFGYFSILAILIACMGILGLSIYSSQQRLKEIAIRKILGAGMRNIVAELSKEFLKPVFVASVIAFPLAWWAMNTWLANFAYRININWLVFLCASVIVMLIASVTVSFQVIKVAIASPVKSLRTE
ncbi:MAG: FtsX-like permease family protein [Chitinophagaceae bacterium]